MLQLKQYHQAAFYRTYLEIDDYGEDKHSRKQAHQIWQILAVEGLSKCTDLVAASGQQVEKGDYSPFKFSA